MANEPSEEDMKKLEAQIKELTKRSEFLDFSADKIHEAAEAAKSKSAASASELDKIARKGAAADKEADKQRRKKG